MRRAHKLCLLLFVPNTPRLGNSRQSVSLLLMVEHMAVKANKQTNIGSNTQVRSQDGSVSDFSLYLCWMVVGVPGERDMSGWQRAGQPVKGRKRKAGEGTMISFIWGRHLVALQSQANLQREPLFPHSHLCASLLRDRAVRGLPGAAATCPRPHTPPPFPPLLF